MSSRAKVQDLPLRAPLVEQGAEGVELPIIEIVPGGRRGIDVRELWQYRGLFGFLVWKEIRVRYAQTILGAGWAILQPLLTMLVFTVIFGQLAAIPSDGVPYAAFSLAALVPWTYFSTALAGSSNSLVSNTNLITKVYFPRLVIPYTPVLAGLVDFAIGFVMMVLVIIGFGLVPDLSALIVLPVLMACMIMTAAGVGSWLSALNIQYRDVKYVVPFVVQVWMYMSPIVYPMSMVPERLRPLYALNPMAGVIEGFRSVMLGTNPVDWSTIVISLIASVLLFVTGSLYFRRMERIFADVA